MNEIKEIWLPIKNYEGIYAVSNLGNVKSLERETINNRYKTKMIWKERPVRQYPNRRGYLMVSLSKKGIDTHYSVHTLVWDAFGDKPRNGRTIQVDHIDDNKQNNGFDNLQLLDNRSNICKSVLKRKNKSSKFIGVSLNKQNKWHSYAEVNGKRKTLGYFNCESLAALAREKYLISKGVT